MFALFGEIQFGFNPSKVIHIGDSSSDIIGANRIGIKTCWINRQGEEWKHAQKPDYIVISLSEVATIVGAKSSIIA